MSVHYIQTISTLPQKQSFKALIAPTWIGERINCFDKSRTTPKQAQNDDDSEIFKWEKVQKTLNYSVQINNFSTKFRRYFELAKSDSAALLRVWFEG